MFKNLLKNVKKSIMPDVMEVIASKYAMLEDIIREESRRVKKLNASLEALKTFIVEQQKEIDQIKKTIKKRVR